MALPRVLTIGADGSLETEVVPAATDLRGRIMSVPPSFGPRKEKALKEVRLRNLCGEIQAEFMPGQPFTLKLVSEAADRFAQIDYDPQQRGTELRVNEFTAPMATDQPIHLRCLLDGSSLEVFANRQASITARVYQVPRGPLQIEVANLAGLRLLDAWDIKPISKDRLTR
jgi:hypothetical protein